jgi:SHS2 domain-containing protein
VGSAVSSRPTLPYEELDHTADLALRIRGATLGDLLGNAALGLSALLCAGPAQEPDVRLEVHVESDDGAALVVDWLNELLYLDQVHERIWHIGEIVKLDETSVRAVIHGRACPERAHTIKAATYHGIELRRDDKGLAITITLDV